MNNPNIINSSARNNPDVNPDSGEPASVARSTSSAGVVPMSSVAMRNPPNSGVVDFPRIRENASAKGYESFVVGSMIEGSASRAIFADDKLSMSGPAAIQAAAASQFMGNIEKSGGFQKAYQSERRVVLAMGPVLAEKSVEDLKMAAVTFVDTPKSPSNEKIKDRLISLARSAASAFRIFAMDDNLIGRRLLKYPQLVMAGIAQIATKLIDKDRQNVIDARARAKAAAQNSRPQAARPAVGIPTALRQVGSTADRPAQTPSRRPG